MATSYDIALLTDARYVQPRNPADSDGYVKNIFDEDALLMAALQRHHNLSAARVDWADPLFDWTSVRAAVFRTTWDYFERISEFRSWIDRTAPLTQLLNSAELVRWNLDKHYLLDMGARGIRIPATQIVERGQSVSLVNAMRELDSAEIIVKPAISGAAWHTYRVDARNAADTERKINELLKRHAFLVQPFLRSVVEEGELSLIVIGGKVTHGVRKIAKAGDFRVQDDHGGTVVEYQPSPEEIAFAERATLSCEPTPVYARVDIVRDGSGELALMEWEGIEPELFLRFYPRAAESLAGEIARSL